MHGRVVQWVLCIWDAEESGTLFESLGTHSGHLHQFLARCKGSVFCPIVHNVLGEGRTETGDVSQQVSAGGVEVHTHRVHTTFHGHVERFLQGRLVYIVLVLAYTDALGFNLHQLGQRVHQSATDGYGTTDGHIVFGEFLSGNLRCRIDGSTVFAHYEHLQLPVVSLVGHEGFGFTAGCTVTDSDGLYLILFHQLGELAGGDAVFALRRMRIDGFVMQEVALCIEANHLTSGTISRVDTHHPFLSEGRGEQQLSEITGKYPDSFFIGLLLAEGGEFCFDAGLQEALVSILYSFLHLQAAFVVATDIASHQPFGTFFIVGRDGYFQQTFGFTSADGQQTMGSTALQRFAEVEVILVLGRFLFLALHHLRGDDGLAGELVSDLVSRTLVFVHLFGNDVAGTFQGIFFVLHFTFHKGTDTGHEVVFALHHQDGGQWLQSLLTGCFGTGLALRFVRQVDVLQFGGIPTSLDTFLQLGGQLALFLDGLEDGLLALGCFGELVVSLLDFAYLHFIQSAGRFLSVSADEGYGGSPVQQGEGIVYLSFGNVQCRCYHFIEYLHKSF